MANSITIKGLAANGLSPVHAHPPITPADADRRMIEQNIRDGITLEFFTDPDQIRQYAAERGVAIDVGALMEHGGMAPATAGAPEDQ